MRKVGRRVCNSNVDGTDYSIAISHHAALFLRVSVGTHSSSLQQRRSHNYIRTSLESELPFSSKTPSRPQLVKDQVLSTLDRAVQAEQSIGFKQAHGWKKRGFRRLRQMLSGEIRGFEAWLRDEFPDRFGVSFTLIVFGERKFTVFKHGMFCVVRYNGSDVQTLMEPDVLADRPTSSLRLLHPPFSSLSIESCQFPLDRNQSILVLTASHPSLVSRPFSNNVELELQNRIRDLNDSLQPFETKYRTEYMLLKNEE